MGGKYTNKLEKTEWEGGGGGVRDKNIHSHFLIASLNLRWSCIDWFCSSFLSWLKIKEAVTVENVSTRGYKDMQVNLERMTQIL